MVVVTAKAIGLLQPSKAGSPTSAPALGGIGVASRPSLKQRGVTCGLGVDGGAGQR